ncbi:MAG TPA: DMT family transporter [Nitrospiria bacterium]|jgi:drug/metabolite transporter (DMT)-like permease|nr:DMT family transporter [Nitrospiria bacterium]
MKTLLYTAFALVAFAANSVLCRLALGAATIDAASFSTIRLASGAFTLLLVMSIFKEKASFTPCGRWVSAILLFAYAVPFSFAYIGLSAGTGALILFGAVQATMILAALRSGERPHQLEWAGLILAIGGLVCLVFPGLTAPSPTSSSLMAVAGIAWGIYSLRGRGAPSPLADTTRNFVHAVPPALGVNLVMLRDLHVSAEGASLAVLSGALASGMGYVVWYAALRGLTAMRAATVQLAVPVLAAAGGVLFLSEPVSLRLVASAIVILGGVGLALAGRQRSVQVKTEK